MCLRQLSEAQCDPAWVILNRECATVLAVGVWMLWKGRRGQRSLLDGRTLRRVLAAAVLTQLLANLCSQWAMGTVGLAVTIPASFGTTIAGGAVLGWAVLHERISLRSVVAVGVILASLSLLGVGSGQVADATSGNMTVSSSSLRIVGGVLAACAAGVIFAILNVTTCHSVRRTASPVTIGFLISLVGVVSLGPLCLYRLGIGYWFHMPVERTILATIAGLLNFIAFAAQGYALQRTTLIHANIVSASQVAMAAVAGIVLFHEMPSVGLLLGVGLTLIGVVGAGSPQQADLATQCRQAPNTRQRLQLQRDMTDRHGNDSGEHKHDVTTAERHTHAKAAGQNLWG